MVVTVAGLFMVCEAAQGAIERLVEAGYGRECISILAKGIHELAEDEVREAEEHPPGEETIGDSITGGVLGGILGLVVGVTSVVLPGSIVAIGPLVGLLGGTAIGATAGAVVGSLRDLGLDERDAHGYQTSIEAGAILVAVHERENAAKQAETILREAHAQDVHVVRLNIPPPAE